MSEHNVRSWVQLLLDTCVDTVRQFDVPAHKDCDTIGVYTANGKVASVGVRIRKGVSLHGISINVNLTPNGFVWIDPCGG